MNTPDRATGPRRAGALGGLALVSSLAMACGAATPTAAPVASSTPSPAAPPPNETIALAPTTPTTPPPPPRVNLYAAAGANMLAAAVQSVPPRVYVPNSNGNTVTVIDPATFKVLFSYPTGQGPQHVVPSHDLKSLWVNNDGANTLTQIDPMTGRPTRTIPATEPYNLYWTPDDKYAVVMAEASQQMTFLDAATMKQQFVVKTDCAGLNHLDFSADGQYTIASCEFSGKIIKVDMVAQKQVGSLALGASTNMPQDVRIAPDGSVFYVADMVAGGVWIIDGNTFSQVGFLPTGVGTHALYFDRAAERMFVINRGNTKVYGRPNGPGSISVVNWATRTVTANWPIPGGGSPDMGNLSPDGKQLWLSGRYDNEVYVIDTTTGAELARIPSGPAPHGLTYWPQPGRIPWATPGRCASPIARRRLPCRASYLPVALGIIVPHAARKVGEVTAVAPAVDVALLDPNVAWDFESLHRMRQVLDQIPALVAVLRGPHHVLDYANVGFRDLVVGGRGIEGATVEQAIPAMREQGFVDLLDRVYRTGETVVGHEFRSDISQDGATREVPFDFTFQAVRDIGGAVAGVVCVSVDVTATVAQRSRARVAAEYAGMHDPLTGLPNRVLFLDRVERILLRRDQGLAAVLFADLDDFKPVNDTAGHRAGDEVLRAVAGVFAEALRDGDTAARIGGDEFAICCEGLTSADDAVQVAERLIAAVSAPVVVDGTEHHVGLSIGIAFVTGTPGETALSLLSDADTAMYRAKRRGQGGYDVFDVQMRIEARRTAELRSGLHLAAADGQLRLRYQPVLSLRTGEVVAVEALLRWAHPRMGMLGPAAFLAEAERSTAALSIGRWTLREAVRQLAEWDTALGLPALRVSVNLSARQLLDPALPQVVVQLLQEHGLAAHRLILEVPELALTSDPLGARAAIDRLRAVGARTAIGDFGAGHSSLAHLRGFPVDAVKIHPAFIGEITRHPDDATVVRAITSVARSLGIVAVAVGVEDAAQLTALTDMRCPMAQGHLWAAPLEADDLLSFLGRKPRSRR